MDKLLKLLREFAGVVPGHRACAYQDDQVIAQAIFEVTPEEFRVAWYDGTHGDYTVFPTWAMALGYFCTQALDRAADGVGAS